MIEPALALLRLQPLEMRGHGGALGVRPDAAILQPGPERQRDEPGRLIGKRGHRGLTPAR